jgi:hypothetical protein
LSFSSIGVALPIEVWLCIDFMRRVTLFGNFMIHLNLTHWATVYATFRSYPSRLNDSIITMPGATT